jgi:Mg/Co/Ni transporter MgtE
MKKLINLGIIVGILWAVAYFILAPLRATIISEPALVTAVICAAIVFCSVVIPFVIKD